MKIATIIIRTLIGLLMLFASISYFFKLSPPPPEMSTSMKTFMDGVSATVYLLPFAKFIELICGLCFVFGKFMKIAIIVLLPITINIFLIHVFLAPSDLPVGGFLLLGNCFLVYRYWDHYKPLFSA